MQIFAVRRIWGTSNHCQSNTCELLTYILPFYSNLPLTFKNKYSINQKVVSNLVFCILTSQEFCLSNKSILPQLANQLNLILNEILNFSLCLVKLSNSEKTVLVTLSLARNSDIQGCLHKQLSFFAVTSLFSDMVNNIVLFENVFVFLCLFQRQFSWSFGKGGGQ